MVALHRASVAQHLVAFLEANQVSRVFTVPGESFLAVLDALYDSDVRAVVGRQEGGVAMMAEAQGKLGQRPGVAFVTRGPGATNASAGVHVASQDSTPIVLFVGQVGTDTRGREAFQEVDYTQMFGAMTKLVERIDRADRVVEVLNRVWATAMNGRPGPVVVELPDDVLGQVVEQPQPRLVQRLPIGVASEQLFRIAERLKAAKAPVAVLGGPLLSDSTNRLAQRFAEAWGLPLACSFRRQGLMDHSHSHYIGDVGLGINPALKQRVVDSDLVLLIGGRMSENPSQGYQLLLVPYPGQELVHVYPGAEELGRNYLADQGVVCDPDAFLEGMSALADGTRRWEGQVQEARQSYLDWTDLLFETPDGSPMPGLMRALLDQAPMDSIVTNGAGNYASWAHRFWRFGRECRTDSQVAPTSGSMGYGLPAAVAASLEHPDRQVICFAGDGCLQMTVQEMATAFEQGCNLLLLLVDNAQYGTIRMHQERDFPARVSATQMPGNPDFVALARAYGWTAEALDADGCAAEQLGRLLQLSGPKLLHVPIGDNWMIRRG